MIISISTVFIILFWHWITDFIIQTDWQAKNKSSSNIALLSHTITYSVLWFIPGVIYIMFNSESYQQWHMSLFILVTFVCHTITDYFTSRLNTYFLKKNNYHNFFVSVGFDQILHYVQLFLTYKLLI